MAGDASQKWILVPYHQCPSMLSDVILAAPLPLFALRGAQNPAGGGREEVLSVPSSMHRPLSFPFLQLSLPLLPSLLPDSHLLLCLFVCPSFYFCDPLSRALFAQLSMPSLPMLGGDAG